MSNPVRTIIFILLFASCADKHRNDNNDAAPLMPANSSIPIKKNTFPTTFDSTLTPFTDPSYKLTLHVFETVSDNEEMNNSTVTFSRIHDDKVEKIFQDS